MFPVATKEGGMCIAVPDVCLVPPVGIPTPFVNLAMCRDAQATSARVLASNKEVITEASTIPMSTGNEAGAMGGIISGVIKGPCSFKTKSSRVLAEGKGVVVHLAVTGQNGTSANAVGIHLVPSQARVLAGM